jgi:hypothetical protein
MRMLGDISSGVGSSVSEVAYLYGTLRTQGRAFSRDIYQFTGRGIPIVKELAKQFKVAESAVMGLVEKGQVGFKDIERAMQSMTDVGGQFHDMMAAQSKTLVGQTSNLADAWDQLKTSMGQSQEGMLKNTISWATDTVRELDKVAKRRNFVLEATGGKGPEDSHVGPQAHFVSKWIDEMMDKNDYHSEVNGFADKWLQKFDKITSLSTGKSPEVVPSGVRRDPKTGKEEIQYGIQTFPNERLNATAPFLREMAEERKAIVRRMDAGIDVSSGNAQLKILDKILKEFNAVQDLEKTKTDKTGGGSAPKDLETLAKMNRATQINVHIENLVRELTNNVETQKEALAMNTNEVAKALVAAVNDIYAIEK